MDDKKRKTNAECEDIANSIPFAMLCNQFEKIGQQSTRSKKLEKIFSPQLKAKLQGQSMYPILRLVLPQLDRERLAYGLKQKAVAKLYVDFILHGNTQTSDSQRLIYFNDPNKNPSGNGEFTDTLEEILESRVQREPSKATIGEVNKLLDKLAAVDGTQKRYILMQISEKFSAREQKWLMRIIFRDLKIGLRHEQVLDYIHQDAKEAYNKSTNLREVAVKFGNMRSDERAASSIAVHTPFHPMLAASFKNQLDLIEKAMKGHAFLMDLKLDGERILCHKKGHEVKWFSRKTTDYSNLYGPVMENFIFEGIHADTCILDGELVGWDEDGECLVPFGSNKTIAREEAEMHDCRRWLFYIVFDLLYLGGPGAKDILERYEVQTQGSLTTVPLRTRRQILAELMVERPHRLEHCKTLVVEAGDSASRKAELMEFFDNAVMGREEGLVIKDLESPYVVGEKSRSSNHWIKMKPEYSDQTTNLDLIVLGAYYSTGKRRAGLLSHFLLGLADQDLQGADGHPTKFYSFCKVGTGYSKEELSELNDRLKDCFHDFDPDHPPSCWHPWNIGKRDDIPQKWIAPEDSIIFEVKCAEITVSDQFSAKFTCRFPRVHCIRYDKHWYEGLTFKDMEQARDTFRSTYSQMNVATNRTGKKKKKKKDAGARKISRRGGKYVANQFLVSKLAEEEEVASQIFEDLEFCIMLGKYELELSDDEDWSADVKPKNKKAFALKDLQRLVSKHGGDVVANVQPTTDYVIAAELTFIVKSLVKKNSNDVIHFSWLLECIQRQEKIPPSFSDYLHISPKTREEFGTNIDKYGDPFFEEIDAKHLKKVLDEVGRQKPHGWKRKWETMVDELDPMLLDSMDNRFNFFWRNRSLYYIDFFTDLGSMEPDEEPVSDLNRRERYSPLDIVAHKIEFYGGTVARSLHLDVTHVILDPTDFTRRAQIVERLAQLRRHPEYWCEKRVIKPQWVDDCVEAGGLLIPSHHDQMIDLNALSFTQQLMAVDSWPIDG